jgi:hypothetical protein
MMVLITDVEGSGIVVVVGLGSRVVCPVVERFVIGFEAGLMTLSEWDDWGYTGEALNGEASRTRNTSAISGPRPYSPSLR